MGWSQETVLKLGQRKPLKTERAVKRTVLLMPGAKLDSFLAYREVG